MRHHSTDKALLEAYIERFGVEHSSPPVELGVHLFPWAEFRKLAPEALRTGRSIDWSKHFPPLPEGADS